MNQKVYALIDCNSFYCSCERVFRPDLKSTPIVVLSNNDGCAISRTQEAKNMGIKMGEPFFKFKNLVDQNKLKVFSSNFALYTNLSDRVMKTIADLCPAIEIYSVDEAFADLSGMSDFYEHGQLIKKTIAQNVGIPVGVGIASTKVLAKLANHLAKKSIKANGVVDLTDLKHLDIALKRVDISDVWGIGRASSQKMHKLGIKTAYDFCYYQNEKLIQKIFTKVGLQIKHELMGVNCFEFGDVYQAKKGIMCSRTFGGVVTDKATLKKTIASYICDAAEKLRKQNSSCSELSIFARTSPFKNIKQYFMSERIRLNSPTCDSRKLIHEAFKLIDRGFIDGLEYKKAGAMLSGFNGAFEMQLDFLSQGDSPRDLDLMKTLDQINYFEGERSLFLGACGLTDNAWRMNREYKSPRYTTCWNSLMMFNKKLVSEAI